MCAYLKAILTIGMQLHAMSLHTILVHFVSIWLINKCQSGIDFIFTSARAQYTPLLWKYLCPVKFSRKNKVKVMKGKHARMSTLLQEQ